MSLEEWWWKVKLGTIPLPPPPSVVCQCLLVRKAMTRRIYLFRLDIKRPESIVSEEAQRLEHHFTPKKNDAAQLYLKANTASSAWNKWESDRNTLERNLPR